MKLNLTTILQKKPILIYPCTTQINSIILSTYFVSNLVADK